MGGDKMMRAWILGALAVTFFVAAPTVALAQEGEAEAEAGGGVSASGEAEADAETDMSFTRAQATGAPRQSAPGNSGPDGGTLGLGGEGLVSGFLGIHGRLQLSEDIGISAAVRFGIGGFSGPGGDYVPFELGFAFSGWFDLLDFDGGRFGLLASIDFDVRNRIDNLPMMGGFTERTDFDIGLGLGIFAEIFLFDFFSIHGQAGFRVAVGGREDATGDIEPNVAMSIFGDAFAGFGFTIWFI